MESNVFTMHSLGGQKMINVVSLPESASLQAIDDGVIYFSPYRDLHEDRVGSFGVRFREDVERSKLLVDTAVWDFATIALAVCAADETINRRNYSEDGWTRAIKLKIHLCNPGRWQPEIHKIERMLRFLTGDFWILEFGDGGCPPPNVDTPRFFHADGVTLLSGGMDSLVGAIDLVTSGVSPLALSHIVTGNKKAQTCFAQEVGCKQFLWNRVTHRPRLIPYGEDSTRSRSLVFFAFASVVTSVLAPFFDEHKKIFVAENGFISLNLASDPLRVGSLSTKTTHPIYMAALQDVFNDIGLNIDFVLNYKFKTKGEMLDQCSNQALLRRHIFESTSCSRYGRKRMHCGACVPCMVRRAAFMKVGWQDTTPYIHKRLMNGMPDVGAMSLACLKLHGVHGEDLLKSRFLFCDRADVANYFGVYKRGLLEVEALLRSHGVL